MATLAFLTKVKDEIGLTIFLSSTLDVYLIILQRSIRLLVYGMTALVLTAFLKMLNFSDFKMGLFMTMTLLGDAAGSFVLTIFADRLGRRKVLLFASVSMVCSGIVFSVSTNYVVLLIAAMIGVISPSVSTEK